MKTVSVLKNTMITRKEVHRTTMASKSINVTRAPDCVTEVRMGKTVLTVSGYFKEKATETAADKMAKVIAAESMTGTLHEKGASASAPASRTRTGN